MARTGLDVARNRWIVTMNPSTSHFMNKIVSAYRLRADERSWRKAAYRSRSRTSERLIVAALAIGMAYTGYGLVQAQQQLAVMQSEFEVGKRDAQQTKEEFARLFASFNSELEKAHAQFASQSHKAETQSLPSGPATSVGPPALTYYVVRDADGNCAVIDFQPSADSDLKVIERSDYDQCDAVIDSKAITARASK
jgi:hypothetical protein